MSQLFTFDKENKTLPYLIGTDEAGRGPLAGPVVSAAVCFKTVNSDIVNELKLINDSKKLTHKQREVLYEIIKSNSIYSISIIDVEEIEKINILQAALKGMRLSCEKIQKLVDSECEVFVDGKIKIPNLQMPQSTIVKGDGKSASIAAASILAKVCRDKLMCEYAKQYPHYDWEANKGYGTKKHIEAIQKYGITPLHRKSFLTNILSQKANEQLRLVF